MSEMNVVGVEKINGRLIVLAMLTVVLAFAAVFLISENASAGFSLSTQTVVGKDTDPLHDGYNDQANVTQLVTNDNAFLSVTYDIKFYLNDSS